MNNNGERKATAPGSGDNRVNFAERLNDFQQRNAILVKLFSSVNALFDNRADREKHFDQYVKGMSTLQDEISKLRRDYNLTEKQSAALIAVESSVQFNKARMMHYNDLVKLLVGTAAEPSPLFATDKDNNKVRLPNLDAAVALYNQYPELREGEDVLSKMNADVINGAKIGAKQKMEGVRDGLKIECRQLHGEKIQLEKAYQNMAKRVDELAERRANINAIKKPDKKVAEQNACDSEANTLKNSLGRLDDQRKNYEARCDAVNAKVDRYYAAGEQMGITHDIQRKDAEWERLLNGKVRGLANDLAFSTQAKQQQNNTYADFYKLFPDAAVAAANDVFNPRQAALTRAAAPPAKPATYTPSANPQVAAALLASREKGNVTTEAGKPEATVNFDATVAEFRQRHDRLLADISKGQEHYASAGERNRHNRGCLVLLQKLHRDIQDFRRDHKLSAKQDAAVGTLHNSVDFNVKRLENVIQIQDILQEKDTREHADTISVKTAKDEEIFLPNMKKAIAAHNSRLDDKNPLGQMARSAIREGMKETKATLDQVRDSLKDECKVLKKQHAQLEQQYEKIDKRLRELQEDGKDAAKLTGRKKEKAFASIEKEKKKILEDSKTLHKSLDDYTTRYEAVKDKAKQYNDAGTAMGVTDAIKHHNKAWGRLLGDKLNNRVGELAHSADAKERHQRVHQGLKDLAPVSNPYQSAAAVSPPYPVNPLAPPGNYGQVGNIVQQPPVGHYKNPVISGGARPAPALQQGGNDYGHLQLGPQPDTTLRRPIPFNPNYGQFTMKPAAGAGPAPAAINAAAPIRAQQAAGSPAPVEQQQPPLPAPNANYAVPNVVPPEPTAVAAAPLDNRFVKFGNLAQPLSNYHLSPPNLDADPHPPVPTRLAGVARAAEIPSTASARSPQSPAQQRPIYDVPPDAPSVAGLTPVGQQQPPAQSPQRVVLPPPMPGAQAQAQSPMAGPGAANLPPPLGPNNLPPVPNAAPMSPTRVPPPRAAMPPAQSPARVATNAAPPAQPAVPPPNAPLPPPFMDPAAQAPGAAQQRGMPVPPPRPARMNAPPAGNVLAPQQGQGNVPNAGDAHQRPTSASVAQQGFRTGGSGPSVDELGGAMRQRRANQGARAAQQDPDATFGRENEGGVNPGQGGVSPRQPRGSGGGGS